MRNRDNTSWDEKIRMILYNRSISDTNCQEYFMGWSDKQTLIRLSNSVRQGKKKREFHQFVLDKIETFDSQGFDLLFNVLEVKPEKMAKHLSFYNALYPKIKNLDQEKIGFRGSMRMLSIKNICNEHLGIY